MIAHTHTLVKTIFLFKISLQDVTIGQLAQSTKAVEYTDNISAEKQDHPQQVSWI